MKYLFWLLPAILCYRPSTTDNGRAIPGIPDRGRELRRLLGMRRRHGDTSVHVVNGKVMMILYHNSQVENGQVLPLTGGKIQLQSEGGRTILQTDKDTTY